MDTFIRDLRQTLRSLRRQPGFTIVTILTLALGIGANTAVFSVVNGVVLRPLPYPSPDRLAFITSQFPNLGFDQFWISPPEFVEFRDRNHSFESVGAYNIGAANLDTTPPSRPVRALISPDLMTTLGVPAMEGRVFNAADAAPNAEAVAVLSWELWQRSYGGDRSVINRVVQINNAATKIVGIMPQGYDVHDQKVEIWLPLTINPATFPNSRGSHFLYLVGRLKSGSTLESARADLDIMLTQWRDQNPNTHVPNETTHRFRIDPLKEDMIGSVRQALIVLQWAVGFVLLIACANLANLLIARADTRMREYAVRSALGASRGRLFRQLMTEGLVLAVAAAVTGSALAWVGLRALIASNPNAIPRTAELSLDWRVLGFTLAVTVVTGLVFGFVPLLHLGKDRAGAAMKEGNTRTTAGVARARLRSALVVVEIALAVLLVVGAGLLIRSFWNLTRVDMGFNRSHLSTFGVVLPNPPYDAVKRVDFYQRLTASLKQLPGVQSVAAMSGLPPLRNVNANDTDFEYIPNNQPPPVPGQAAPFPAENVDFYQYVTLGYTDTMGIPVVRGRSFEDKDLAGAPVALVNESLVRRFFSDREPIGQRLRPCCGDTVPWFTIVGVLKDVKQGGVAAAAGTEFYMLTDQSPKAQGFAPGSMNFVVRSTGGIDQLGSGFRRSVSALDPGLPLIQMRSMNDVVDDAIARPRFLTMLLGIFAGLALFLAAVGTYGILAYLVTERSQEIGIRIALGADRGRILRLVLGRGLLLSGLGLVIGIGASIGLTRVIATLLFNVKPIDPVTLGGVAGVMALAAAIACAVPAWRATRVDPIRVLRGE